MSYSGGIPALSIVDCRLLRPCNRLITGYIRWPETLRHTRRMRNVDPIAFSTIFSIALLHFPTVAAAVAAADHVTFAFRLNCSWKTNCAPLAAWNLTFWLTTAAISNRQHKIQVNPKPKIQRTVSQSCKVQFFKRLPRFLLTSKINSIMQTKKQQRFWPKFASHLRWLQSKLPNKKTSCCDEDEIEKNGSRKIATNIRVWWQSPLTPWRPINPLPCHQITSMPKKNKKLWATGRENGASLRLASLFWERSPKIKKKFKWKSIAAGRAKKKKCWPFFQFSFFQLTRQLRRSKPENHKQKLWLSDGHWTSWRYRFSNLAH